MLEDEKAATTVGLLRRAITHFRAHGIQTERVMTDNGSCYRATIHALACKTLRIKHLRTRPYHPRTNSKAERFIPTILADSAYTAIYANSHQRQHAPPASSTSTTTNDHTAPPTANHPYND